MKTSLSVFVGISYAVALICAFIYSGEFIFYSGAALISALVLINDYNQNRANLISFILSSFVLLATLWSLVLHEV